MTLLADGNCRTCKAPVAWVITPKGGNMPIDPEPVADGNIWVVNVFDGRAVIGVSLSHDGVPEGKLAYQSHFVSCPQAKEWRKKR